MIHALNVSVHVFLSKMFYVVYFWYQIRLTLYASFDGTYLVCV